MNEVCIDTEIMLQLKNMDYQRKQNFLTVLKGFTPIPQLETKSENKVIMMAGYLK
jgi:hypothetical protein